VNPYRILLADDHRILRQGIRRIIEEKPGLEVVGGVDDGIELLKAVKEMKPDMVIVDISMPRLDGIGATRQIKENDSRIKVLILTMYKDKDFLFQAVSAGADGYLVKEDADIELCNAIDTVRQGGSYISPLLSRTVTESFVEMSQGHNLRSPDQELTARQIEVLKLISRGKSSREIGELLFISVRTVENHRANIMGKLGLRKNIDLVKYAIRHGYLPADEM
jgi:DNA-binding NarL/FixJ family response regulator